MTVDERSNAASAGGEDTPQGSCSDPPLHRPGGDSAVFVDRACRPRNDDLRPSEIDAAVAGAAAAAALTGLDGDAPPAPRRRKSRRASARVSAAVRSRGTADADDDAPPPTGSAASRRSGVSTRIGRSAARGAAASAAAASRADGSAPTAAPRRSARKRNGSRSDFDGAEETVRRKKEAKRKDEEEEARKAAKAVVEEELEKGEEGTQSCCICLDIPDEFELSGVDGCDHRYCFGCIERWAETAENACPQCKRRFTRIRRVRRRRKKDDGDGDGNNDGRHEKNSKRVKRRDQRSDDFGDGSPLREGSFGEWVDPRPVVVRSAPLPLLPDAFPDFRRGDSASRALFDSDDDEEYRRFVRRPSRNGSPLETYAIGGSGGVVSSPSAGTSSVVAGSFGGPGSTAETALEIGDDDSDVEVIEVIEVS